MQDTCSYKYEPLNKLYRIRVALELDNVAGDATMVHQRTPDPEQDEVHLENGWLAWIMQLDRGMKIVLQYVKNTKPFFGLSVWACGYAENLVHLARGHKS